LALFGPRGYRQGITSFEARLSPTDNSITEDFFIIEEFDSDVVLVTRNFVETSVVQLKWTTLPDLLLVITERWSLKLTNVYLGQLNLLKSALFSHNIDAGDSYRLFYSNHAARRSRLSVLHDIWLQMYIQWCWFAVITGKALEMGRQ
jgi:hypothetical protein